MPWAIGRRQMERSAAAMQSCPCAMQLRKQKPPLRQKPRARHIWWMHYVPWLLTRIPRMSPCKVQPGFLLVLESGSCRLLLLTVVTGPLIPVPPLPPRPLRRRRLLQCSGCAQATIDSTDARGPLLPDVASPAKMPKWEVAKRVLPSHAQLQSGVASAR